MLSYVLYHTCVSCTYILLAFVLSQRHFPVYWCSITASILVAKIKDELFCIYWYKKQETKGMNTSQVDFGNGVEFREYWASSKVMH